MTPTSPINGLLLHTSERGLFLTFRDGTPVPGILSLAVEHSATSPLPEVTIRMVPRVRSGVLHPTTERSPLGLGYRIENPNGDVASHSPINKTADDRRTAAAPVFFRRHDRCLHCGHTSDEAKVKPYAVEYHRFMSGILPGAFFPDGLNPLFNDPAHGVRLLEAALVEYHRIKSVGRVYENIVSDFAHGSAPGVSGVDQVPVGGDTSAGALFSTDSVAGEQRP